MAVTSFKALSRHLSGWTEENHVTSVRATGLRASSEPATSRIRRNVNNSAAKFGSSRVIFLSVAQRMNCLQLLNRKNTTVKRLTDKQDIIK